MPVSKKNFLAFCMCFSAFAAVFAGGKSDSLSYKKLEKKYPQSEYFFSLGHGASLSNAESSAKLGICQSLGETISGEQKTFQSDSSLGKQESSLSININETVLFQHITGIEIKETWQEKNGDWFAVAVLNKKKAGDYYSSLAKEQGQKIQSLITKAKFSVPSLESAELADQAYKMALENQYNLNLLSAIDRFQFQKLSMPYISTANLALTAKEIASSVKVSVYVDGDKNEILKNALESALLKKGMSVVSQGESFRIQGTFSYEQVTSLDSANVFVRYNFASPVIEIASGSVVKPFTLQGREGHVSKEEAVNRCITRICQKIKEEF